MPASNAGSSTFSTALNTGIRLYAWNTKPIDDARPLVRSASDNAWRSTPSSSTRPPSTSSSPEQQLSSVVLPEPDGPITATNSPSCTTRSMLRSASTSSAPVRYTLRTASAMSSWSVTFSPSAGKRLRLAHAHSAQRFRELLRPAWAQGRDRVGHVAGGLARPLERDALVAAQHEPAAVLGLDRHRLGHQPVVDVDDHAVVARVERA